MRVARALACILPLTALAQGFPWELSPRLPVAAPTLFLGVGGQTLAIPSVATVEAVEGEWTCATYRRGRGFGACISAYAEWWYAPEHALRGNLGVEYASLYLTAPSEPLPLRNGTMLQTEFQLRSLLWLLRGELTWKARLWRWLWCGIGGWGAVQWQLQQEQWEVVLQPADYFFRTVPPSRQRRIDQARSVRIRPYGIGIRARLGYDLALARQRPLYAAPALVVGSSLISLARSAAWQRWEVGLELTLSVGLLEH